MPTCVALVPARAGSQRVPGKNLLELAGHPLIAYSIAAMPTWVRAVMRMPATAITSNSGLAGNP